MAEIRYTHPPPPRARPSQPKSEFGAQTVGAPIPRISRLMALAVQLENLLNSEGLDYRDLAQLGGVSRTRITQIFNLLHLAPDIQERLLFLEPQARGRERITEAAIRRLSSISDWQDQCCAFQKMVSFDRTTMVNHENAEEAGVLKRTLNDHPVIDSQSKRPKIQGS